MRINVWKPGDSWDGHRVDPGEPQVIQRAELAGWSLSAGSAPVLAAGIDSVRVAGQRKSTPRSIVCAIFFFKVLGIETGP